MKSCMAAWRSATAVAFLLTVSFEIAPAEATAMTPVGRVVQLLGSLKGEVEQDGKDEQQQYDKYACWCEKTMKRKSVDIAEGKASIKEMDEAMQRLSADKGDLVATVKQLAKEIQENIDSQAEATSIRQEEATGYRTRRIESEQCIGALESAVKVLDGAGTDKKNLGADRNVLTLINQAQMVIPRGDVRQAIQARALLSGRSEKDLEAINFFLSHSMDSDVKHQTLAAAQVSNNPFGDYAPQSTQINGILKNMYDTFVQDLEKENGDEAQKNKSFKELMKTKQEELRALKLSHEQKVRDEAQTDSDLANTQQERADARVQLKEDEKFFETTKVACSAKAMAWAERCRLRTMELNGIAQAVTILGDAQESGHFTDFLQMSAPLSDRRQHALSKVPHRPQFAQIRAALKAGGHFDKVIVAIDSMIGSLRSEDADDIAHRDRCEGKQGENENNLGSLNHQIKLTRAEQLKVENKQTKALEDKVVVEAALKKNGEDMTQLTGAREQAVATLKKDARRFANAIEALEGAIDALRNFYRKNNKEASFISRARNSPPVEKEYTVDPDKAPLTMEGGSSHRGPRTEWEGDYGGRKSENSGIVAILEMIKEDFQKDEAAAHKEDADAEVIFREQKDDLTASKTAATKRLVNLEKALARFSDQISDFSNEDEELQGKVGEEQKTESLIETDCAWVESHFDSRSEKRKNEIAGLTEAKNYLAGGKYVDEGPASTE